MQKKISFIGEFFKALKMVLPFTLILAVLIGAVLSQGSWAVFFKDSLRWGGIVSGLATVYLSGYIALHRKATGVDPDLSYTVGAPEAGPSDPGYNVSTGLPMVGSIGGTDISGKRYGE